jgi:F0F1-type ATP synthase assembly protein I
VTGSQPTGPGGSEGPTGRQQSKAYEGAFEAVFAVIIGAGLGYWADTQWDSSPWALIIGVVLGFAAMVLRLLKLGDELGMSDKIGSDGYGADSDDPKNEPKNPSDPSSPTGSGGG